MILLDTFPAARFKLRSSPQHLLARVLKIHGCLSQFGVLLLHCLRYLNVERIARLRNSSTSCARFLNLACVSSPFKSFS